jgi:hypothetical protein
LLAEDAPELDEDGRRELNKAYAEEEAADDYGEEIVPGSADNGEHARVDGSIIQGLRPKASGDTLVCEDSHRAELDYGTDEGDAQTHSLWELKFFGGRNHGKEADSHGNNSDHKRFFWRGYIIF